MKRFTSFQAGLIMVTKIITITIIAIVNKYTSIDYILCQALLKHFPYIISLVVTETL